MSRLIKPQAFKRQTAAVGGGWVGGCQVEFTLI